MASLVLRRDLSLEVPKLLVGTVQPYQTLAGPALTTSFLHQPELLPFQSTPFSHAAVAPLYFHTLLHTLAEFAETPRAVRHSHVRQQHAPKADFWDSVGILNCFYYSAHNTSWHGENRQGKADPISSQRRRAAQHPAMGAVELVRPSHRKESDVKLTLFDREHQPIASMLMTGPKDESRLGADTDGRFSSVASATQSSQRRTPLSFQAPPTDPSVYTATRPGAEDLDLSNVAAVMVGGTQVYGGLYGEVVSMGEDQGYAHRAHYWTDDLSASLAASSSPEAQTTRGSGADAAKTEAVGTAPTVMPPWVLYDCVQRFFFRLHRDGRFGDDELVAPAEGWRLSAHHVVQTSDAVFGQPLDVVCATPRVDPHYRLPPWRSQLGLPVISGGDVPCVTLRCEVRQGGQVVSTGVYFFCRWA